MYHNCRPELTILGYPLSPSKYTILTQWIIAFLVYHIALCNKIPNKSPCYSHTPTHRQVSQEKTSPTEYQNSLTFLPSETLATSTHLYSLVSLMYPLRISRLWGNCKSHPTTSPKSREPWVLHCLNACCIHLYWSVSDLVKACKYGPHHPGPPLTDLWVPRGSNKQATKTDLRKMYTKL